MSPSVTSFVHLVNNNDTVNADIRQILKTLGVFVEFSVFNVVI